MIRDLTVGKPSSVLWRFCLPLFGSIVFQQLYNIADSLVAGRFLGEHALAAVGNSYEITLIFIAFAFGCSMGSSVVVSRLFGAKAYTDLKTAVRTSAIASGILCLILMISGLAENTALLQMIHTPDDILADSAVYLKIYLFGLPFLFFYNISNGIFSGLGDSRTPFLFLAASSTANIAVDILFVTAFKMGIAGVAWATLLCQGVSCILAVYVVIRKLDTIPTEKKPAVFSAGLLTEMASIAIPSTLQQSFISIGNIIIQGVINGFGTSVIAGYAASVKLNNLVITSFTTLGNGVSNFTAQNVGAGKPERVRVGFFSGVRLVWCLSVPLMVLYYFFGRQLLLFFLDSSAEGAVMTGITFLRILSPFYPVISAKLIADGVLKGSGRMNRFMIATFTDLILRVTLAVVLSGTRLGASGIWCAWPVGWSAAAVASISFCLMKDSR